MKLVKASYKYQKQIVEMLEEWTEDIKNNPSSNHSPYAIFKNDYHDFDYYLDNLELKEPVDGKVPDSTFFLYDEEKDRMIGASNIRHYLNDKLKYSGGHIGDGIRPSERHKGYGTLLVKLSLEECKKLGIKKVLMTADKDNIGSIKTITNNNGILHSTFINEDNKEECRFYISLEDKNFKLLNKPLNKEEFINEVNRCLGCKNSTCIEGCPIRNNIPEFIRLAKDNKLDVARSLIEEKSIFGNICGSICPHEKQCEGHCIRNKMSSPVKIGAIERYIVDNTSLNIKPNNLSYKVATIGSGVSSLAFALYLARKGIKVDIYEKSSYIGGLLADGIPSYRLDKNYLSLIIDELTKLGTTFYLNKDIKNIEEIRNKYDALFIGIGAGIPNIMKLENNSLPGIYNSKDFLILSNTSPLLPNFKKSIEGIGKKVLVVGGGNAAIDCARNALRIEGVESVEILYRRSELEMPANKEEIYQAKLEGIKINTLINPVKAIGTSHLQFVECAIMELGEVDSSGRRRPVESSLPHKRLSANTLILALGYNNDPSIADNSSLSIDKWGVIQVDENNLTSLENVYAGGDDASADNTVVNAMKEGLNAAKHFYNKINKL